MAAVYNLTLGVAASAAGMAFLLARHWDMSTNTRANIGSSLIWPGVGFASAGARMLLMPSAEETAVAALRVHDSSARLRTALGFGAMQRGALAVGGVAF